MRCHANANADGDANSDGDTNTDTDANTDGHPDPNGHPDPDGYPDAVFDPNAVARAAFGHTIAVESCDQLLWRAFRSLESDSPAGQHAAGLHCCDPMRCICADNQYSSDRYQHLSGHRNHFVV